MALIVVRITHMVCAELEPFLLLSPSVAVRAIARELSSGRSAGGKLEAAQDDCVSRTKKRHSWQASYLDAERERLRERASRRLRSSRRMSAFKKPMRQDVRYVT